MKTLTLKVLAADMQKGTNSYTSSMYCPIAQAVKRAGLPGFNGVLPWGIYLDDKSTIKLPEGINQKVKNMCAFVDIQLGCTSENIISSWGEDIEPTKPKDFEFEITIPY